MKQNTFEQQNTKTWKRLDRLLQELQKPKKSVNQYSDKKQLPDLYRKICHHYSLAKHRNYSPILVERLHQLMLNSYRVLYKPRYSILAVLGELILQSFPRSLQKNWKLFFISFGIIYIPMLGMGIACFINPDLIYLLMDAEQVAELEFMYNPDNTIIGRKDGQETSSRVLMFGHYIMNNISIDFRIFAGGMTFGLLTILFLLFNGFYIGGIAGYLTQLGYNETFWSFVPGHSGFELNAAVIAGLAGLVLAKAMLLPGQYTRVDALKIAGKESSVLILGAAVMTFIAAAIEAFWSPTVAFSLSTKITIGIITWIVLYWYFFAVGRLPKGVDADV